MSNGHVPGSGALDQDIVDAARGLRALFNKRKDTMESEALMAKVREQSDAALAAIATATEVYRMKEAERAVGAPGAPTAQEQMILGALDMVRRSDAIHALYMSQMRLAADNPDNPVFQKAINAELSVTTSLGAKNEAQWATIGKAQETENNRADSDNVAGRTDAMNKATESDERTARMQDETNDAEIAQRDRAVAADTTNTALREDRADKRLQISEEGANARDASADKRELRAATLDEKIRIDDAAAANADRAVGPQTPENRAEWLRVFDSERDELGNFRDEDEAEEPAPGTAATKKELPEASDKGGAGVVNDDDFDDEQNEQMIQKKEAFVKRQEQRRATAKKNLINYGPHAPPTPDGGLMKNDDHDEELYRSAQEVVEETGAQIKAATEQLREARKRQQKRRDRQAMKDK